MQLQVEPLKNQVSDRGEDKDGLALTRTMENGRAIISSGDLEHLGLNCKIAIAALKH